MHRCCLCLPAAELRAQSRYPRQTKWTQRACSQGRWSHTSMIYCILGRGAVARCPSTEQTGQGVQVRCRKQFEKLQLREVMKENGAPRIDARQDTHFKHTYSPSVLSYLNSPNNNKTQQQSNATTIKWNDKIQRTTFNTTTTTTTKTKTTKTTTTKTTTATTP